MVPSCGTRVGSEPFGFSLVPSSVSPADHRTWVGPGGEPNARALVARPAPGSRLELITRRRILYWLAVMVAVLVVGTIIGLIWADTSDVAGAIAVVTNIAGSVGIVVLLIALVVTRRQRPTV